jgi:VWFA-related protein
MLVTLLAASVSLTGSPQEPPPIEFGSGVRMIRLDVSVVGKRGVPVAGLLPGDFEVFEDGRPVELSLFEAFDSDQPRAAAAEAPEAGLAEPPRRVILVMDTGLMSMGELLRARDSAERYLRLHTGEGDWVRVINRATGQAWGGFMPDDRNHLVSAIRGISWRRQGLWGSDADAVTAPIADRFDSGFDGPGPSESSTSEVFLSQFAQTSGLLGMLEAILVQLGGIDGRKALVLVSPGFPQLRNLDRRLQQVSTLAREASTPVYFIDSRGLDGLLPEPGRQMRPAFEMAWARSGGAQDLAEATGGFTARFSNSLTRALSRVAAEMRTYYVLGYTPTRPDDGRFRKIKVKVNVDGLKARTKKGYLAGARRR